MVTNCHHHLFWRRTCNQQPNTPPVPIADKAMQRKFDIRGGAARSVPTCLRMSNARTAARNIMARQANPTRRTSFFILLFHSCWSSVFAVVWRSLRSLWTIRGFCSRIFAKLTGFRDLSVFYIRRGHCIWQNPPKNRFLSIDALSGMG